MRRQEGRGRIVHGVQGCWVSPLAWERMQSMRLRQRMQRMRSRQRIQRIQSMPLSLMPLCKPKPTPGRTAYKCRDCRMNHRQQTTQRACVPRRMPRGTRMTTLGTTRTTLVTTPRAPELPATQSPCFLLPGPATARLPTAMTV